MITEAHVVERSNFCYPYTVRLGAFHASLVKLITILTIETFGLGGFVATLVNVSDKLTHCATRLAVVDEGRPCFVVFVIPMENE